MKQTVILQPGQSQNVPFSVIPTALGTYTATVDGLSKQFEVVEAHVPVQLQITELFVGTRPNPAPSNPDDRIYVRVKNNGQEDVYVNCDIYDWQAWWEEPVGSDRRWRKGGTIPAGGFKDFTQQIRHVAGDTTYFRVEILVNDVVVIDVPRFYIIPGKIYTGSTWIAVGECTYKRTGMVVLWYSQSGTCSIWDGSYFYPPGRLGYPVYHQSFTFRTRDGSSWPAVFIPIFDENLTSTQLWEARFSGGYAGGGWKEVYFEFRPA